MNAGPDDALCRFVARANEVVEQLARGVRQLRRALLAAVIGEYGMLQITAENAA